MKVENWRAIVIGTLLVIFASPLTGLAQDKAPQDRQNSNSSRSAPENGAKNVPAGTDDSNPTDAEKIARLQRSIDESSRQIDELNKRLNDPDSEFKQAESAFADLDKQRTSLKQALDAATAQGSADKDELDRKLSELEPKYKLAKERFDLAIKERKTLQEQIATLQQKVQQDSEALKKLKGDVPPTTQPAAEATAGATTPPSAAPPTTGGPTKPAVTNANTATPETQPPTGAPAAPAMPGITPPTTAAPANPENANAAAPAKPSSPELIEARQNAERKQAEAQNAEQEVASVTERIDALQKSIELEQRLFETSRKKVENAQATERTLYESLQKKWRAGATQDELNDLQTQIADARARLSEAQNEMRERTDRRDKYQAELSALQGEHIAAMEAAQAKKAEADRAQQKVEHLESPLSPHNLWIWCVDHGPRVLGIVIAMFALLWFTRVAHSRFVRLLARHGLGTLEDRENRAKTLAAVFRSAVKIAVYAGGGLMLLTEIGVNIVPLMGGAAVLGLAVAFGAQNLIRDYFYGFMILLENQYGINDVVKIGDIAGQVERISLRITVLRGLDGTVHFVPNGEITRVSNMTHEWSRALFDIPIAYKEDVDRVMTELVELAKELRRDQEFRGHILEMPEMLGVDDFADSAIVIRFYIKTRPLKQWVVKREMLRRIKKRFDELGIEIPFPQRTVYHRYEGSSEVPGGDGREFAQQPGAHM